jgi:alkylation response protein AidB-like acyl-CoA dehydrogenase
MRQRGWVAGPPPYPRGASDESNTFRDAVVSLALRDLNDDLERRDHDGEFSREAWLKCAEIGLLGLPVPEQYGGTGADATTIAAALEGLGYGCRDNGLIFSLNAQMWACELPLVRFGSEEQKERYLPGLCDGSLIAGHAMTEPDTGSDAFAVATTAKQTDTGWVLNGTKTFVTNAPVSDVFVVFASTDPRLGFAGLSAFIVSRDAVGLTIGKPFSKMGVRTSPIGELFLADCEVAADALLGSVGAGMAIFNLAMRWERGLILAAATGTMHRQLERCITYARERKQFGQPIGHFQAVSHKLVNMRLRLETARMMLFQLAARFDEGTANDLDAALAKLHLSECFVHSSLDALDIHGGYGYVTESGFEREVRDALASRIYSGTSDMQRNVVAGQLGL